MVKVLLINPQRSLKNPNTQFTSPPIGITALAPFLQINGFDTIIIDTVGEDIHRKELLPSGVYRCGMSNEELMKQVEQFKPDVVGISCSFTPRFNNVVAISRLIKKLMPNIKIVVGGMHATVCADTVLDEESIDFVILGEAEIPFLHLLTKIRMGQTDYDKLSAIGFRSPKGKVISKERILVDILDALPIPMYDLLPMEKYFNSGIRRDSLSRHVRQASIVTSRGCPMQCTFCSSGSLWGNKWRFRSFQHVLAEMELLTRVYKVREISFEDDNISMDMGRFEAILRNIITRNIDITWNTPNGIHINGITIETVRLMKSSGCTRLNFGIESGDENILKNVMRKNLDLNKVREVVKMCSDEGIVTLGYFVLGMPGETEQSLSKTLEFAKSLPLHEIGLFYATPFPSTVLESATKENGYLKGDIRQLEAEDEIESKILIETPMLDTNKLIEFKQTFFREFYKQKVWERPFYYGMRALGNPNLIRRALWKM